MPTLPTVSNNDRPNVTGAAATPANARVVFTPSLMADLRVFRPLGVHLGGDVPPADCEVSKDSFKCCTGFNQVIIAEVAEWGAV